tara:strand:+ start:527 stop:754 length:228 start_codon:yes stop_codon:yes gene_type:complete
MKLNLYTALQKQYEADIERNKTNILVYLENGVGVAEHDDTIESMDKLIEQLANAEDKLKTLKENFYEFVRHERLL